MTFCFLIPRSLEQVPETGRWRFIAFSSKWETKLAKDQHAAFLKEYRDKILPHDHPVTRQIASVVEAVLRANKLGTIANMGPLIAYNSSGMAAGDEDIFDPDTQERELASVNEDSASLSLDGRDVMREWNLIVVNDLSMVNAACSFSE